MVLDRFLKPKWQHPNPQVRKRALLELEDDTSDALSHIAQHDSSAELRQLALRRLADLDLLARAARDDADAEVRAAASERFRQLLAGLRDESPPLNTRMQLVNGQLEGELLEFLALQAKEAELRRAALGHVQRQSVLGDAALDDTDPHNRLRALERIEQRSTLERVARDSRKHDKQLHRLAQEKLDALVAELERPQRVREQAQTICAALRALGRSGHWSRDRERLSELEQQWTTIAEEVDAELTQQYSEARDAFLRAHAQYLDTERRLAPVRAAQEALLEELREVENQAKPTDAQSDQTLDELDQKLTSVKKRWHDIEKLPSNEQETADAQFSRAQQSLSGQLALLRQQGKVLKALGDVCAQAERLQAQDKALHEEQLSKLEQRWRDRPKADETSEAIDSLCHRYESTHGQLRERLHQEQVERDKLGEELPTKLSELEIALKSGEAKHAIPLHNEVSAKLDRLHSLEPQSKRLHKLQHRLQRLRPQVRELEGWRRWGTNKAREQLCEQVEQLIGSNEDPNVLAKKIHALQEEWKALDRSGGHASRPLWERFQETCHRAYVPCAQYFEQQAQRRHQNQAHKEALCEELESFLATTDWENVDWKAVAARVRKAYHTWHQAGPVDRKRRRGLDKRFKRVMDSIEQHLAPERERNLNERRELIEQIKALENVADTNQAIEQCKQLRHQWHTTVPAQRKEEKVLWREFQAASDAIFGRRQAERNERQQTQRDNLAHKERICTEIESLCVVNKDHVEAAKRQVHKLQAEWKSLGHVPKAAVASVEKRYREALKAFRDNEIRLCRQAEQEALERLRVKAQVCERVENLVEQGNGPDETLNELVEQWERLQALSDIETEQSLQVRFATARKQVESGRVLDSSELQGNQRRLEQMCLQMELLAGVESPAEFKEARMQYQVERLTQALQQGRGNEEQEARELLRQWWLIGPAPSSPRQSLSKRFESASQAFLARPIQD